MNRKSTITTAFAAIACGIAISACGGGSSHKATAGTNAELAISECMRAHGVPNFPDPGKGAGGSEGMTVLLTGSSVVTVHGIPFSGPAFEAAKKTCGFMSDGGNGPPQLSESYRLAALHFAHTQNRLQQRHRCRGQFIILLDQ